MRLSGKPMSALAIAAVCGLGIAHAQITSGSVTVLPEREPTPVRRPAPEPAGDAANRQARAATVLTQTTIGQASPEVQTPAPVQAQSASQAAVPTAAQNTGNAASGRVLSTFTLESPNNDPSAMAPTAPPVPEPEAIPQLEAVPQPAPDSEPAPASELAMELEPMPVPVPIADQPAAGVDSVDDTQVVGELDALQLREWMMQMRSAVTDHPSVRVARLQAQASSAAVDQARAARLPQLTLSSDLGNDRSVRDGVQTSSAGGVADERDVQISPTLDADLLLFDGGAARAGVDAAQSRVQAGDVATQSTSSVIALRAAQTLIDLATLRAQIQLAEANLTEVRRLRAMIQERAAAGRDSPSDMFRMNSRVDEARNTLEQRIAAFNGARADYAEVFRSEPMILGLPPVYAPVPDVVQTAIERAIQQNPDLLEAQALARAADLEFSARRASRWPQVSLGASVTGYDVTREGEDYYDSFIGLRLSTPLFDGGRRKAQINQAQRQATLEQARVDEIRANIVRALSQAYASRASLKPQLSSLDAQVRANRATLDAYEEQFFSGRRPLNDLVTAQRELYGAQAQQLTLRGELHTQHFTIRRLTGDLLTDYGLTPDAG